MTEKEGWAIFATAMTMLEDIPGDTLLERIARLKAYHMEWQKIVQNLESQLRSERQEAANSPAVRTLEGK